MCILNWQLSYGAQEIISLFGDEAFWPCVRAYIASSHFRVNGNSHERLTPLSRRYAIPTFRGNAAPLFRKTSKVEHDAARFRLGSHFPKAMDIPYYWKSPELDPSPTSVTKIDERKLRFRL